jgi:hypothetical protein
MAEISSFALPIENIAEAYQHVMGETNVDPELCRLILPLYAYANQTGSPKLEPLALAILEEVKWDWPWYKSWYAHFEQTKSWPYMWNNGEKDMAHMLRYSATRQLRRHRVAMLAHSLSHISVNVRTFHKSKDFMEKRGWELTSSIGCVVEDEVKAQFLASVELSDWRTWPPFFPGDRTSIKGRLHPVNHDLYQPIKSA